MKVSAVITCYNEEENMRECLGALIGQTYPADKYEIIVVDGGSQDRTQDIIKEFTKVHSNINLVIEHKKGTAAGRNAGIKASTYDYVAFIDADCVAPPGWLNTLVTGYISAKKINKDFVAVGGSNFPKGESSPFIQAIGIASDSFFGSFHSIQGRVYKVPIEVESLSTLNALYEKKALFEVGLFDESLGSDAEDAEMNYRLRRKGHRLMYLPDCFVWHRFRPNSKSWFKNMFRYGRGRARLFKRHPLVIFSVYLLPIGFILIMASVSFSLFNRLFLWPLLYFPIVLIVSLYQAAAKGKPHLIFYVFWVYLLTHFGYGLGEIGGIFMRK